MLEVRGLEVRYHAAVAVEDLDLHVEEGEVVALIGPNGAGKTSTLLALLGLVACRGEIRYQERTLNGVEPEERVARGLVLVHERPLFPRLAERRRQLAATMSGGEQQMLAIGRALMARPRLLLLDEPSLGLAPLIVKEIFGILRRLKAEGTTILLVEQNARAALELADRGYVLEAGRVVLQGPAADLREDPRVIEHYLGIHGEGRG